MNILAIDTATECCSVALKSDNGVDQLKEITPSGHSKLVLGMVDSLLAKNAITLNDVDLLAVDIGPGSFTGLRIGIGIAQGLAYAASIPVIGISALQALASAASNQNCNLILPAIDARMKQVYWAAFEANSGKQLSPPSVTNPTNVSIDSLYRIENKTIATIGSGWDTYYQELLIALGNEVVIQHTPNQFPEAKSIAALAYKSPKSDHIEAKMLNAAYIRNDIARPSST